MTTFNGLSKEQLADILRHLTPQEAAELDLLLGPISSDPVQFAVDCLQLEPDPWQEDFLLSDRKQIILNCSRQSGKSTCAAVLSLHTALTQPNSLTLILSPSIRQSRELYRKILDFLWMLPFRPVMREQTKLSFQLANGSRVVSLPGKEGTVRGFSNVTLVLVDEASRVSDELYQAVRPMLAVSGGRIALLSTPFGQRGFFHQEWVEGGDSWLRIEAPASMCPRISHDFLVAERNRIGDWWFDQEYMCQFRSSNDNYFGYDLVMAAVSQEVSPLFGLPSHRRPHQDAFVYSEIEELQ